MDLCLPSYLHAPFAVAAAEAGKHVICEKPLTGYFCDTGTGRPVGETPKHLMLREAVRTAEAMIETAERKHVRLMYAENWLYSPVVQRVMSLARDAGGTILDIRGHEAHSGSASEFSKRWETSGGSALLHLGIHPLGTAIYLKQWEGQRRWGKPIGVRELEG